MDYKKTIKKIIKKNKYKTLGKILESNWSDDVDVDDGKMRSLLDIPKDKNISDVYTSGEKLANDLVEKTGSEKEASSMLAFVANINSELDVFDRALSYISEKDYNKEEE